MALDHIAGPYAAWVCERQAANQVRQRTVLGEAICSPCVVDESLISDLYILFVNCAYLEPTMSVAGDLLSARWMGQKAAVRRELLEFW